MSTHSKQPDSNREPLVSERKSITTKLRTLVDYFICFNYFNCFICFNKSPLKMMKNAFFHLKSSFRSQDI